MEELCVFGVFFFITLNLPSTLYRGARTLIQQTLVIDARTSHENRDVTFAHSINIVTLPERVNLLDQTISVQIKTDFITGFLSFVTKFTDLLKMDMQLMFLRDACKTFMPTF